MRHTSLVGRIALSVVVSLASLCVAAQAFANTSKLDKEGAPQLTKGWSDSKNKLCCGYPLSEEKGFRFTFYWMADEKRHDDPSRWDGLPDRVLDIQQVGKAIEQQDIYTRDGQFLATSTASFVAELKMEGAGWLSDGRVINWAGRCRYGVGTCFRVLDPKRYPYGMGAMLRPLVPFRSVAVDRKLISIGETLYVPEFDGMRLPDGSVHDGCLRADDVGGAIRRRKIDFYVTYLENFLYVYKQQKGNRYFTPHIEAPRCAFLKDKR